MCDAKLSAAACSQQNDALPSCSDFVFLRAQQQLYVDKTRYVYALARIVGGSFSLFRPRGFGKSTLLSTLEELFLHGTEPYDGHPSYFMGLYIDGRWQERPGAYTVARLDFASCCENHPLKASEFKAWLKRCLTDLAQRMGIEIAPKRTLNVSWLFDDLLSDAPNKSLVLLIDDCDAPLRAAASMDDFNAVQYVLSDVYALIKRHSGKFRLVFCTGTIRFGSQNSFFSGSFIRDKSPSPRFAACCGFSTAELKQYFEPALRQAAAQLNPAPAASVSAAAVESLIEQLTLWYGGFYFADNGAEPVLQPSSVLTFLKQAKIQWRPFRSAEPADFPAVFREQLQHLELCKKYLRQTLEEQQNGRDTRVAKSDFTKPLPTPPSISMCCSAGRVI